MTLYLFLLIVPTPLYEVSIHNIDLIQKVESKEDVMKRIKDLQDYALVQNHLSKFNIAFLIN